MTYLTFDYLNKRSKIFHKAFEDSLLKEAKIYATKIFLSQRHSDHDEVKEAAGFLESFDVDLYVDYLDHELPDKTSEESASILRNKIYNSEKFILLATPNSIESLWIPWELGLGDAFLNSENVAILPLTRNSNYWSEREYYRLYGTIKISNQDRWCYFPPGQKGVRLENWLIDNSLRLKG